VGAGDIILDYYHATLVDLPAHAGQFGAMYVIPIIYVPLLMITHVAAFYLLAAPGAAAWYRRSSTGAVSQHSLDRGA
jgi:hypothetical protein